MQCLDFDSLVGMRLVDRRHNMDALAVLAARMPADNIHDFNETKSNEKMVLKTKNNGMTEKTIYE